MFCTTNILLTILFLSDQLQIILSFGYSQQYRRYHHPLAKLLKNEGDIPLLVPANIQSGENVQKLVPSQLYHKLPAGHDENDFLGAANSYGGLKKLSVMSAKNNQKAKLSAAPENVNRVREMTSQLWPMGIVPYFIDKESYDSATVKRIFKAMRTIESVSCVIFRELDQPPQRSLDSWLHFTNPRQERECQHDFAGVDGGIEVVLSFECLRPEEILHSLLHAMGFRDEVTHPHRDQYIRVLWENIQPKYRDLFRIRFEDAAYKLVEYDPMSIMHFHDRAFSGNGGPTIAALVPGLQFPSTTTLSQLDIMRLKLAFGQECNKRNIGDLLDTCKNSLTPQQKLNEEHLDDEHHEENQQGNEAAEPPKGEEVTEKTPSANEKEEKGVVADVKEDENHDEQLTNGDEAQKADAPLAVAVEAEKKDEPLANAEEAEKKDEPLADAEEAEKKDEPLTDADGAQNGDEHLVDADGAEKENKSLDVEGAEHKDEPLADAGGADKEENTNPAELKFVSINSGFQKG